MFNSKLKMLWNIKVNHKKEGKNYYNANYNANHMGQTLKEQNLDNNHNFQYNSIKYKYSMISNCHTP